MAMSLRMTVLRLAALTAGCCLGCGQTALPAGDVGAQASTRPASRACTYRVETQRLGELPRTYRGALPGPGWRRSAIVVREQGPPRQEYVVVDGGAAHPKYDQVGDEAGGGIRFSRDGLHLAYTARRGRQAFVVLDGQAGPGWRGVREPTLGAGGRIAHAAHDGTGWRIVVDGRAGPRWDKVYRVQFSPDGRRLARFVRSGAVCQLLLDDQAGLTFQLPRRTPFFCFSPDSRRWACNARQNRLRGLAK